MLVISWWQCRTYHIIHLWLVVFSALITLYFCLIDLDDCKKQMYDYVPPWIEPMDSHYLFVCLIVLWTSSCIQKFTSFTLCGCPSINLFDKNCQFDQEWAQIVWLGCFRVMGSWLHPWFHPLIYEDAVTGIVLIFHSIYALNVAEFDDSSQSDDNFTLISLILCCLRTGRAVFLIIN